jgi:Icc-related predicted phosphoesterase
MKLLCVSDQIDPLIYTNSIKESFADVDLILSAGDLPMDYLDFIASTLNKPLLFVLGNHHIEDNPSHRTAIHVDMKVRCKKGFIVAGLGGCMQRAQHNYQRKNQFTDFQMYIRMMKLLPALFLNRVFRGRFLDILLTHAPPLETPGEEDKFHRGFKSFHWFIRVFRPKYLVHGQIHLYDLREARSNKYSDTLIINAYSHYLIDTGEKA